MVMTNWLLAIIIVSNFAYTQYLIYRLSDGIEDFLKRSLNGENEAGAVCVKK